MDTRNYVIDCLEILGVDYTETDLDWYVNNIHNYSDFNWNGDGVITDFPLMVKDRIKIVEETLNSRKSVSKFI